MHSMIDFYPLLTSSQFNRGQINVQKSDAKYKNLSELFVLAGKSDIKSFYDKEILDYKREYSKW